MGWPCERPAGFVTRCPGVGGQRVTFPSSDRQKAAKLLRSDCGVASTAPRVLRRESLSPRRPVKLWALRKERDHPKIERLSEELPRTLVRKTGSVKARCIVELDRFSGLLPDEARRTRSDDGDIPGAIVTQLIQIAGSLLILSGFILTTWGWLNPKSATYLTVNALGSAVLAVQAATEAQWGFLLLEGVWAIVSFAGLIRVASTGKEQVTDGS